MVSEVDDRFRCPECGKAGDHADVGYDKDEFDYVLPHTWTQHLRSLKYTNREAKHVLDLGPWCKGGTPDGPCDDDWCRGHGNERD